VRKGWRSDTEATERGRTAHRQEFVLSRGEFAGMLPSDEWLAVIDTLATAIDRAGEGKLADGYTALQAGLARALERQNRGERGSAEAVSRWCWACEWFAGRYLR
jgi:hypothetical protein